MFRFSLKNKLIALVVLAFVLFGILTNIFIFRSIKNTFFKISEEEIFISNLEKAHGIINSFKSGEDLVRLIAQHDKIIEYLENKELDEDKARLENKEILDILENYNLDDAYLSIYIMDLNGLTLVSTDPSFVGKNYNFREYFQKALDDQPWVYVAVGVTSKQVGYYFSYPIKSSKGEIIGVMVSKMKPDSIHDNIYVSGLDRDKRVMLVDQKGIIIYSSDKSIIYKSLGVLSKEELAIIESEKQFSNIKIESLGFNNILGKVCEGQCSNFTIQFFNILEQKEELLSISRIGVYPFYLMSEYDLEDLMERTKTTTNVSIALISLLAIFTIAIIILFVNKFLRPLSILKKCAFEISKDNFSYKYNIKTGDELEDLGNTFNLMSGKLKKSQKNLKQKLRISKRVNKLLVGRELIMRDLKKENTQLRKELRSRKNKND